MALVPAEGSVPRFAGELVPGTSSFRGAGGALFRGFFVGVSPQYFVPWSSAHARRFCRCAAPPAKLPYRFCRYSYASCWSFSLTDGMNVAAYAKDVRELIQARGILPGGSCREQPRRLHEECADPFHPQLGLSLLQVSPGLQKMLCQLPSCLEWVVGVGLPPSLWGWPVRVRKSAASRRWAS